MTIKQQIGLVVAICALWLADAAVEPSTETRIATTILISLLIGGFVYSVHDFERRTERRETIETATEKVDTLIDALKGIEAALQVRHDPEAERVAAAYGLEAALTYPRRRDFWETEDYLEALEKWAATLPPELRPQATKSPLA